MLSKRFILAINPLGGMKKGMGVLEQVKPVFDQAGVDLTIHETEYAGHVGHLVNSMDLSDYDGFCIIGGDGTLHEVVNGLLTRKDGLDIPIGCIPGGTGNSFMHHLDCLDVVESAKRIVAGQSRSIDVARVAMGDEVVYCFNIVGWGIVTDINTMAEKLRWMGGSRYTFTTFVHVARLKWRKAKLIMDGEEYQGDFVFVIGCNTRYTGKGMCLAPRAKLNDGLIDLVVIRDATRRQLLKMFPKVFDGSHLKYPYVEYYQVREFAVVPDEDETLNLDGELKGTTPFEVKMVPGAFRVFA
ncbi:MAG: diacylglycerol/lipid kinase family protein [Fidelibacterota bacterium]